MLHAESVKKISTLCDINNINKMEIIYYPSYILTNTAMNEIQLKDRYVYKVEINSIQENPFHTEIVKMLNINYFKMDNLNDIRWGIHIVSNSERVCQLYFDSFGSCGSLNGIKVCFEKNHIIKWVSHNIPLFIKYDAP